MARNLSGYFFRNDWVLVVTTFFLSCLGLLAIYSVALGQGLGQFINFNKQAIWLVIGFAVMFVAASIDYRFWRRWGIIGYAIGLILLVLVLTPLGASIRGTRGWFNLGLFSFQPVELVKIFLIIVLANIYSRQARVIHRFWHLLFIGLIVLIPFILVLLQPDFGSGMVLFLTWFISFFLVTKNKRHVVLILFTLLATGVVAWFFVFADYQKNRIMTFLDPSLDPLGRGYNVSQSKIAVGAGQLAGRGLGFGSQSQLKFIPESQTDFIFAVIAEELGLIGVSLLLGFFALLFYRLIKIAAGAADDFGLFLVIMTMILIFIHVFINIGMGVGILPVTGISLPLVSYGGSFLVVIMFLLGVCLNVGRAGQVARRAQI